MIIQCAIAVAFLFISTTTLMPQVNSKPLMDKVDFLEQNREKYGKEFELLSSENTGTNGLLEWLMQLIRTLIQLTFKLIEVVQDFINIVNLIENLINAIQTLFQLIEQLIELIQNVIPSTVQTYNSIT